MEKLGYYRNKNYGTIGEKTNRIMEKPKIWNFDLLWKKLCH